MNIVTFKSRSFPIHFITMFPINQDDEMSKVTSLKDGAGWLRACNLQLYSHVEWSIKVRRHHFQIYIFCVFHIFNIPALRSFGILLSNLQPPSGEKIFRWGMRTMVHETCHMLNPQTWLYVCCLFCLYGCVCVYHMIHNMVKYVLCIFWGDIDIFLFPC